MEYHNRTINTHAHVQKHCCAACVGTYIHTKLAGIMRNDMHAKYQHVCLLFHSLYTTNHPTQKATFEEIK